MAKPTMLQTLLGRPSQSYTLPQQKDYHSTKAHMRAIASLTNSIQPELTPVMGINNNNNKPVSLHLDSHVITSPTSNADSNSNSSDEDDIFYTPNSSPRTSMAPRDSEIIIATRTPLTSRSTTTSISSNSLDGHSIFSLDSNPVSDSTHITTPSAHTYTDEDWAKDVRWLVPPSSTKKKPKSTSYYVSAQLPPKIIPLPPPHPHPGPRPRSRPKSRSKSVGKVNRCMNMGALVEEEDEDRESAHRTSQGSLRSSERAKADSLTSHSLKRQNNRPSHLGRRKSRSLEDLKNIRTRDSASVSTLYPSSTSYTPSIPSSGTPGFTSLTLPRAPQPATLLNNKRISVLGGSDGKIDLTKSGMAQTTMATVEVTKGLAGNSKNSGVFGFLSRARSRSVSAAKAKPVGSGNGDGTDAVLSFTSYRRPPDYVPDGSVLVQVWAVGVDGIDAKLAGVVFNSNSRGKPSKLRSNSDGDTRVSSPPSKPGLFRSVSVKSNKSNHHRSRSESDDNSRFGRSAGSGRSGIDPDVGYIPGRSFVGRVLECGWDVKDELVKKGEWVVGLLDVKKCGALQEFLIVDRHKVHKIPHPIIPSVSALADNNPSPAQNSSPTSSTYRTPPQTRINSTSRPSPGPNSTSRLSRPTNLRLDLNPNPIPPPMTIDEYALLALCGVFAYRAVRTLAYAFGKPTAVDQFPQSPVTGSGAGGRNINEHYGQNGDGDTRNRRRVLVLRGHDGVGAMAVQMLVKRGWRVSVHAPLVPSAMGRRDEQEEEEEEERRVKMYMDSVERRVRRWGAEEVVFDDGGEGYGYGVNTATGERGEDNGEDLEGEGVSAIVRVIERLIGDGDVFDAVLDTVGGKEIWEVSERLLRNRKRSTEVGRVSLDRQNSVTSTTGSVTPRLGLKRGLSLKRNRKDGSDVQGPTSNSNSKDTTGTDTGMGQFTTLVGDTPNRPIPTASDHFKAGLRSMKNTHTHTQKTQDGTTRQDDVSGSRKGRVGYAWVSIAQDIDWEGEDVRDSLGAVLAIVGREGVRPWVGEDANINADTTGSGRVVPFERTPYVFVADGPLGHGGTAVVKLVE